MSPLKEFCAKLLLEVEAGIEEINKEKFTGNIVKFQRSLGVVKRAMENLQDRVLQHGFLDGKDEITFFKELKPQFYSKLIFFHKVYNLEAGLPDGDVFNKKGYFQKEFDHIKGFYEDNKFWYQYLKCGESYLDEKLFRRNQQNTPLSWRIYDINVHSGFTTGYDYIFARIIANEMLVDYLQKALSAIDNENVPGKAFLKPLIWTDSKVGLVEMCYSFKAKGTFNNGKATLKEITDFFQKVFQVEINNPTRDLQEILRRKNGYSTYLDSLKQSYLKYVDAIEEKAAR